MRTPMFTRDLGSGYGLALRDGSTVEAVHELIVKNLGRLRPWEHWAHDELTEDRIRAFTRAELLEWVDGRNLPCVITFDGAVVGTAGARINGYTSSAELGYWIDAGHEGHGAVTRAVAALLQALFRDHDVARAEIRTGVENTRSRAVATRLGFTHEGTLRSAALVGTERQDIAVYGLLAGDLTP